MTRIVGIRAGLSVDHLVGVDRGARFHELGGPGLYSGLGARLIDGTSVRLSTELPGDDARFETLFHELEIDIRFSRRVGGVPRVWILDSDEGRRIVGTAPVDGVELESGAEDAVVDVPAFTLEGFADGLAGLLESSPRDRVTEPPAVVGIDPHQLALKGEGASYLARVAPPGAVILPSRLQLRLLGDDPRQTARALASSLDRPIVARLDRDGMYVATESGAWVVCDERVQVFDTTGAGDASAGAIVAALAAGADPVEAAMLGVSVARLTLSDWGHRGLLAQAPLASPLNHIVSTKEV